MRLLLDSHVLLWALFEPRRLANSVAAEIQTSTSAILVSPASIYELEWKKAKGALPFPDVADWERVLDAGGFTMVPISSSAAQTAARLPRLHKDPWDRVLVAQAMTESAVLATKDPELAAYGVPTLW